MSLKNLSDIKPKLTLIGAGPGAADLITLRGLNALKKANVVLVDALVSEELIQNVPHGVPVISVGKRAGKHSFTQDEINDLIVESAFLHGHVVRLKGGDPFVFGRGYEEIEFANSFGIETEVIPGISSALAVPANLNIPVTARKVSESFWVVTGTTQAGAISGDVALAAQSTATVVILMGLNKLEEIMNLFHAAGKVDTPVAVIQNGTLKNERCVIAAVSNITEKVKQEGIESPAIIIIGEVVRYARIVETVLQKVMTQ
ncbi:MAG: uroporphyrinogen-III C-methyltransferase [Bacteroidota bacterium]